MDANETFLALGVALAAGLVIGFEREQSHGQKPGSRIALGGARTHPLFALVGAVSALLAEKWGVVAFLIGFTGLLAMIVVSYAQDLREGERGLTSEAALALTFLLGALAGTTGIIEPISRRMLLVLSLSVVSTLLLSMKVPLHAFIRKLSPDDVFATLKFLLVAVVVLPLLPDKALGPWGVLNPQKIGLMVVLIAGISFAGYAAVRLFGARRGLGATGLLGGLVSSTAVTLSFSGRAKSAPALHHSLALAIMLASAIMFGRVLVVVAIVNRALVQTLAVPLVAMLLAGLAYAAYLYWRSSKHRTEAEQVEFHNPFELSSALKFAALYVVVLLGSKAATHYLGNSGTYLAGLLAGVTDVDAITLSMAELARGGLDSKVAVTTILLASASNTLAKGGMAISVGGWVFGKRIALGFGLVILAGAIALAAIWLVR